MAREHARILTRIWRDPDFRARTPAAQRAYILVLTQRDLNYAGVAPLAVARWARASEHTTAEDVEVALKELEDHAFVVIDRDTDELLVRSFIRNDGLIEQPKVLRVAVREALATESEALRRALAGELRRVEVPAEKRGYDGLPQAIARAASTLRGAVGEPVREPVAGPVRERVAEPVREPVSRRSGEPVAAPSDNPSPDPSPSRAIARGRSLEPETEPETEPSVGGDLGGSRTRATPARPAAASGSAGPPTPTPSTTNSAPTPGSRPGFTEQPCGRRHSPDEPCRRCGEARQQRTHDEGQARRSAAAVVAGCGMCDGEGRLLEVGRFLPVSPSTACDHVTDQRQQIADARDEPS